VIEFLRILVELVVNTAMVFIKVSEKVSSLLQIMIPILRYKIRRYG